MIASRFNLLPIFRGHWKGLTNERDESISPDLFARSILLLVPIAMLVLAVVFHWQLAAPSALLAAVSLLAGSLVSAFTHLSTLRVRLFELSKEHDEGLDIEQKMVDETAAHLLTAAFGCVANAVILVIGMNVSSGPQGQLVGVLAAVAIAFSSWVVLLFIICLPRLYGAYVQINSVSMDLSGFTKGRKRERSPEVP